MVIFTAIFHRHGNRPSTPVTFRILAEGPILPPCQTGPAALYYPQYKHLSRESQRRVDTTMG